MATSQVLVFKVLEFGLQEVLRFMVIIFGLQIGCLSKSLRPTAAFLEGFPSLSLNISTRKLFDLFSDLEKGCRGSLTRCQLTNWRNGNRLRA